MRVSCCFDLPGHGMEWARGAAMTAFACFMGRQEAARTVRDSVCAAQLKVSRGE